MITFELKGESALWQLPSEVFARYSAPLPAPSQVAGILGAALGHKLTGKERKTGGWEYSPDWIQWLSESKPKVAITLLSPVKHRSLNINGLSTPNELPASYGGNKTLRIFQTILEDPHYKIAVQLEKHMKEEELLNALKNPTFPIFLGNTHHWGKIINVKNEEHPKAPWAQQTQELPNSAYNWCCQIDLTQKERLKVDGFIKIPTDKTPQEIQEWNWLPTCQ